MVAMGIMADNNTSPSGYSRVRVLSTIISWLICIIIIIVRESVRDREVNGSHSTCAKTFSFSASLDLDVTAGSSLIAQRRH